MAKTKDPIQSILRMDLCSFIEKSFHTLNPKTKYLHNWHIELIAEKLEKVTRGEIKRLIINMPPRYLKSICVSVAWPAWLLGNQPAERIIVASHSSNLSVKHSVDTRKIMQSEWYQQIFPHVKFASDQNEKTKFMTDKLGFRMASSVHSSITGEGGNFLIVDDPITPQAAMSELERKNVLEWFDQTFSTRLDDKKRGGIVVVMQRLHEDDLSGALLARGGWEHLCLPVMDEIGGLLHEEREGIAEIQRVREDLGEFGFAAQYMQNPLSADGGIIKKAWLKFAKSYEEGQVFQSWDTAIKTGESSDYSACVTFVETANGYVVVDVFREKLQYPDLKRAIAKEAEKWGAGAVLIEDKASGQSLIQDLRAETKLPIIAVMPKDDKLTRLAAVSPMIEAGKVALFKAQWNDLLVSEMLSFPNGKHDDMVDALSQFLNWKRTKVELAPRIRGL